MTEDSNNSNIAENVKWCNLIKTYKITDLYASKQFHFLRNQFCLDLRMLKTNLHYLFINYCSLEI
jgi:hypothetical protein